jgi:glutathione synthase/RimK-type ligase-like ATP-grasp enzyme
MAATDGDKSGILVVATVHWASATRLCLALAEAGLALTLLAPEGHALHGQPGIRTRRLGRTFRAALRLLKQEIAHRPPALVIPADEGAIELVRAAACQRAIARLVERSIAAPDAFHVAASKSRLIDLARTLGLLVPETRPIAGPEHLRSLLADTPLPTVLKLDAGFGGLGVRIVRSRDEAIAAFRSLREDAGWWSAVKRSLRQVDMHPVRALLQKPRSIALQAHVAGRPANRAVFCRDGKVLAGLSVEAIETTNDTGPATVVRVLDHPAMTEAAQRIVGWLGLSGFVGFDFVLEAESGRAFLLEMNLRPTQICHLAHDAASDMIGALAHAVAGLPAVRAIPNFTGATVALFPQERWRDPGSPHLSTAFHDVPWHAPEIIRAYRRPVSPVRPDWLDRLRGRHAGVPQIATETVDV